MKVMLEEYQKKRDFTRTSEPGPQTKADGKGSLTFVVQKHAARRLHYDFRLELDGALKSWSVPKGPSLNPKEKRLAVMVEDHPLDYASFEGNIPKGSYGAGQVIVWDRGIYSPDEDGKLSFDNRGEASERMRKGLAAGKLSFTLAGQKLRGSWTLVKTRRGENDWLLIKHRDEFADSERDILEDERSVASDLSIEDLKAGRLPRKAASAGAIASARKTEMPKKLEPMLASLVEQPFSHERWLFEPKLDGVRALAFCDWSQPEKGQIRLLSRRGLDVTAQYPSLVEDLRGQPAHSGSRVRQAILDGEIVTLDEHGIPSFERLQPRLNLTRAAYIREAERKIPVFYYVFDILYLDGYDLISVPLDERKRVLAQSFVPSERTHLVHSFEEDGLVAYEAAQELGLEGLLAKKRDSIYEPGKRSRNWLKVKATRSDDFVIGGYKKGQGSRAKTFGSLLLGYYDEEDRLVYCGHVGSGFRDRDLADLLPQLDRLKAKECPFSVPPPKAEAKDASWVRPELVAEVKFASWTEDGRLRAPVFLALRPDKASREASAPGMVPPPGETPAKNSSGLEESVRQVLEQLENPKPEFWIEVAGERIKLTNLDKEFWPATKERGALSKRELIRYYAHVAPYVLPHLRDRPITLTRYPNGIEGEYFFQKHWESKLPSFVETVWLYSSHNEGDGEYLLINNLPTLIWLGQLADLELHTWYSRVSQAPENYNLPETYAGSEENIDASLLNYPDFMVFDLDPYIYSGRERTGEEPALNHQAFAKT
ncbi:MAG TPA: non-homologous end-joining DNA ligase, partial [Dehalococcoidia bacterium]|nr:non-homologous end-joining DNA ligase [Dehalococcoidia bacterium]